MKVGQLVMLSQYGMNAIQNSAARTSDGTSPIGIVLRINKDVEVRYPYTVKWVNVSTDPNSPWHGTNESSIYSRRELRYASR